MLAQLLTDSVSLLCSSLASSSAGSISWITMGQSNAADAANFIPSATFNQIFTVGGANCVNIVYRGKAECLTVNAGRHHVRLC